MADGWNGGPPVEAQQLGGTTGQRRVGRYMKHALRRNALRRGAVTTAWRSCNYVHWQSAHAAASSASARWANSEACCLVLLGAAGAWRGASTASSNTFPVDESIAWMWKVVVLTCSRA